MTACGSVWVSGSGLCLYRGLGMTLHVCLGEGMGMFDSDLSVGVFL